MATRINLLPKTERVRTATNVPGLILLVVALIVVFGLGLGYYLLSIERSDLQDELEVKRQTRAELEAQVAALSEYKVLATRVANMERVVTSVYAGRTLVSSVLSDLSLVIPENVWLTSMAITAGDPQVMTEAGKLVSGTGQLTMQGNTYSFPDVAGYIVRLQLVGALQAITLNSAGPPIGTVDPDREVRGFSLIAGLVNTQAADTQLPMTKVKVEGL